MLWRWYENNRWTCFSFEKCSHIDFYFRQGVPSIDIDATSTIFFQETFIVFHDRKVRCAINRYDSLSEEKSPWGYIDNETGKPTPIPHFHLKTLQLIKEEKLFSKFCFHSLGLVSFIVNFETSTIFFNSGKTAELKHFRCKRKDGHIVLLPFEDCKEEADDPNYFDDEETEEEDYSSEEEEDEEQYTFDTHDGWFSKHNIRIKSADSSLKTCFICWEQDTETFSNPFIELMQCQNHAFHYKCLETWFHQRADCPVCRKNYGPIFGNQPLNGTMTVHVLPLSLPGFPDHSTLQIDYHFPTSVQSYDQPVPGAQLPEDCRSAYLPNCEPGQKILQLLKIAWDRRLIFTVGISLTHGVEAGQRIVWNGIHHKTNISGLYGYPDDSYFPLVLSELASLGIS